jgi:hypothetical protein
MALWLLRVLTLGDVQRTRCITVHRRLLPLPPCALKIEQLRATHTHNDVLHPESKQQTTPAAPRDALECVAALARTRECRQNCFCFAYRGPQVDRLHVLELKRDVE